MMGRQKSAALKNLHNEVRAQRCQETGLWLISSDVTGEQDNKISYGPTAVINPAGHIVAQVSLLEVVMISAEIPLSH
jgi:predicted amidohydrolase